MTTTFNFDSFFNKQVLDNENFGIAVVRALSDDDFKFVASKFGLQTYRIDTKSYPIGKFFFHNLDETTFTENMDRLWSLLNRKVSECCEENSTDLKFGLNMTQNYGNGQDATLVTSKKIVFSREQLNQRACQKLAAMKNKILRKKNAKITKVEKKIPKTVVIEGIEYDLIPKKK